jgi:ribosome maturation factor RimP
VYDLQNSADFADKLAMVITAMGYELLGYEFDTIAKNTLLRLYIDKEQPISLEDCRIVSGQVNAMLAVELPTAGRYILEVSSPGIERPLFTIEHYHKQLGKKIKISTETPYLGRRNFTGVLRQILPDSSLELLLDDGQILTVLCAEINKGNTVADYNAKSKGAKT